jgi:hypothetical protein
MKIEIECSRGLRPNVDMIYFIGANEVACYKAFQDRDPNEFSAACRAGNISVKGRLEPIPLNRVQI